VIIYLLYPEGLCMVVRISLYSFHDRDVRVWVAGLRCRLAEMRARALDTDDSKEHQRKVTACECYPHGAKQTTASCAQHYDHYKHDVHCALSKLLAHSTSAQYDQLCTTQINADASTQHVSTA
jgi:hypothetical protein